MDQLMSQNTNNFNLIHKTVSHLGVSQVTSGKNTTSVFKCSLDESQFFIVSFFEQLLQFGLGCSLFDVLLIYKLRTKKLINK